MFAIREGAMFPTPQKSIALLTIYPFSSYYHYLLSQAGLLVAVSMSNIFEASGRISTLVIVESRLRKNVRFFAPVYHRKLILINLEVHLVICLFSRMKILQTFYRVEKFIKTTLYGWIRSIVSIGLFKK